MCVCVCVCVCWWGADPDMPAIGAIAVGENSANVSWSPARRDPPTNPGARFYVEYVKAADAGSTLSGG